MLAVEGLSKQTKAFCIVRGHLNSLSRELNSGGKTIIAERRIGGSEDNKNSFSTDKPLKT